MDYKHNGSSNGRMTPQKISRRRCRSECLASAPSLQIERFNLKHNTEHYAIKSAQQSLRNSYTIKPSHQLKVQEYYGAKGGDFLPRMRDNVKENLTNGHQSYLVDIKETYLREVDAHKERLNGCYRTRPDVHFNPRNSIFDANRRRIRARSESEPHELYSVSQNLRSCNTREYISLKRTREASSPPLQESKIMTQKVTPPALNTQRLKSKSPVIGSLRAKLRPTTPTRRHSPLLRKSKTPIRVVKPVEKEEEEDSASVHSTVDGGKEPEDADSLEDDDDDLGAWPTDDDLDGSVTDPEDNYKTHLSTSAAIVNDKNVTVQSVVEECVMQQLPAPFAPSLFPNCPPYITFATHEEKGPTMPAVVQKILKWKLTTITPVIVRRILFHTGFRLLRKTNDWMGTWGKHMKSPCFKTLRSYQKFNHLPGSFQIGRKDRVWRNLQNQMVKHGKKEFGFMPRTFVIPHDLKTLRSVWPRYAQRNAKFIIKPPASARGTGIRVVNQWAQIPKRKPLIVQRYIDRPLLINGSKFDLRLYVLVTSMNPLRVYMHTDGLARFASVKYSEKADTLNDRYMHLTNYSINKLSSNYTKNEDANACQGHKWTLKSLWSYLAEQGYNVTMLWSALKNLVLRTILAGEAPINAMTKVNVQSRYNCFELFGVDVILDSELIPWLLEVNISPSLHSASPLDAHVKGPLVTALLNTVMYQVPPKIPVDQQQEIVQELGLKGPLCFDKRIYCTGLSKVERQKHNQYSVKGITRNEYLNSILDNLTPDDIRCLLISEDELARSSPLERVFPTQMSHHYLAYTDCPRYYNRLLDAWEHRYSGTRRQDGIDLLRNYCEKSVHLEVPPQTFQKDSNDSNEPEINDGETPLTVVNGFIETDIIESEDETKMASSSSCSSNNGDSSNSKSVVNNISENATSKALENSNSLVIASSTMNNVNNTTTTTTTTNNNSNNTTTTTTNGTATLYPVPPLSPSQSSQSDQENNVGIVNGPLPIKTGGIEMTTKKLVVVDDAATNAEANLIFVNQ